METRKPGKPRGVLRLEPEWGAFLHSRHAPPADLASFVEHFWIVGWDLRGQSPRVVETLPHPSVHVILELGDSSVAGPSTRRFVRKLEGGGRVFGIKFLPGGFYPFAGWPVARIADRVLTIGEVFGDECPTLEERVLAHHDDEPMIVAAAEFLRQRMPKPDPTAEEAGRFVARILADPEINKVGDLVDRVGLSARQLQRLFSRYIGVSPKWVIQRYRLHEALARIEEGGAPNWPQLALDLGYSDQAHFIHAFKALVGRTPGEYAAGLAAS